jgi:hypothetical protein
MPYNSDRHPPSHATWALITLIAAYADDWKGKWGEICILKGKRLYFVDHEGVDESSASGEAESYELHAPREYADGFCRLSAKKRIHGQRKRTWKQIKHRSSS